MKNNQKVITNIVLAVAVIAIIGIAGYSAWSKKSNTNITEPLSTKADTSNWKTYTNTKYGFEFKYPQDWVLETNYQSDENLIAVISSPETIKVRRDCYEGCGPDILFSYYSSISEIHNVKANNIVVKNLSDYVYKSILVSNPQKITFAGYNAYEVTKLGYSVYFTIMIEKDGHIYQILFGNDGSKQELDETENKILSTFKFTK